MPTFTLSALRSLALDRLDGNSTLYTNPEIDFVVNEAVRLTSLFTGFFRNTVHLPGFTVANQLVYNTPAGMLVPIIVSFEGRQIQKTSFKRLVRTRQNWATATTSAYGQVEYWSPIGIGKFIMSPIDSVGNKDVTLTGLGEPPLLVNPSDVLVIENEYVEIITAYCAHRLPLKIGGKIFADGSLELNEFYSKLQQRMRYEGFKGPKYGLVRQGADMMATK